MGRHNARGNGCARARSGERDAANTGDEEQIGIAGGA